MVATQHRSGRRSEKRGYMSPQNGVEVEAQPIGKTAKDWEGQVVNGEFHLGQYLGGSDRSAVFLTAYDDQDPQQAAIKFIPADSEAAEVQLARWESATKLSHPHLLGIFQIGRCQLGGVNLIYIVMEYAEENLSQILPQRALTPDEARGMLTPALDALAYIHDQGFVHGHLSPSNIMASGDQIKLSVDRLCPVSEATARPNPRPLSVAHPALFPTDDVWALGTLLVEVLTQRVPAFVSSGLVEPIVPASLPAPFFDIARNCLRKDTRRRWTVSDIALGIRALPSPDDQITPEHRTPEQKTPAPRTTSANRRNIMSTSAIALLLVAVVASPKLLRREPKPRSVAAPLAESANSSEKKTQAQPMNETVSAAQVADAAKTNLTVTRPSSPPGQSNSAASPVVHSTVQPQVISQVLPEVPAGARDTIRGTVRVSVRVTVDSLGNVTEVLINEPGPSTYFARLAARAAQQWKFSPAGLDALNASREWLVRFAFSATETKAIAVQSGSSPRLPANQ
jgi:TonB family protein